MSNTKSNGNVEQVVFYRPEDSCWVGVCLTFNLIVEGSDQDAVSSELRKLSLDYIKFVRENGLADSLLNRPAPQEYWDIYNAAKENRNNLGLMIVDMQPSAIVTKYFKENLVTA